ncbi:MAG TPA: radical SAM protein [Vicinamibacterales bacterium]|nr:radical SAM protein [Vicinamibacterales bacterium]
MTLAPLGRIVYGPVASRRLGRSLGINLLPAGMKVCNMNCAYCQYGFTRGAVMKFRGQGGGWPTPQAVGDALAARLAQAAACGELLDRLTVAGHGEPTLHPDFDEVTTRLRAVRDRVAPGLPLAILSNSTTAGWTDVRAALGRYDERYMKLDAGDPLVFAQVNDGGASFLDVLDGLSTLPSVVVQAMFVTDANGAVDNTGDGAVEEWLRALERVHATGVHIYTLQREPALGSLRKVPARRLREIAERVHALRIPAQIF